MTFHNRKLLNSASRGIVRVRAQGIDFKSVLAELKTNYSDFVGRQEDGLNDVRQELEETNARMTRLHLGEGQEESTANGLDNGEATLAFLSAAARRPVGVEEINSDAIRTYSGVYSHWLRRGDALPAEIKASMQTGSSPDGGFFVPPQMSRDILTRARETSPMREIARVQPTTSDSFEFPIDVNDASTGGWVGETEQRDTTASPKVGLQRIETNEQFAMPEVTQKLLDDASFDVEDWLVEKISDKLGRDEDSAFVVGDGSSKPRGFLSYGATATIEDDDARKWGKLQYVPTGANGALGASGADALHDVVSKLRPIFRRGAVWVMNRETAALVRKLKNNSGDYLWSDGLSQDQPARLLGFRVRDDFEGMPAPAANSFSIALGDFRRGYMILDRTAVRTLRDPFTKKGFVKFYSTKRVGGDVVNFDAIKLLRFSTA